jgi:hypothetical protein
MSGLSAVACPEDKVLVVVCVACVVWVDAVGLAVEPTIVELADVVVRVVVWLVLVLVLTPVLLLVLVTLVWDAIWLKVVTVTVTVLGGGVSVEVVAMVVTVVTVATLLREPAGVTLLLRFDSKESS